MFHQDLRFSFWTRRLKGINTHHLSVAGRCPSCSVVSTPLFYIRHSPVSRDETPLSFTLVLKVGTQCTKSLQTQYSIYHSEIFSIYIYLIISIYVYVYFCLCIYLYLPIPGLISVSVSVSKCVYYSYIYICICITSTSTHISIRLSLSTYIYVCLCLF